MNSDEAKPTAVTHHKGATPKRLTLQSTLALTSVLVGVSAVLLHLLGTAVHQAYLGAWGLDAGAFPKSTDWLAVYGYHGVWNGLGLLYNSLKENVGWVFLASVAVALYVALLFGPLNPSTSLQSIGLSKAGLRPFLRRFVQAGLVGLLIAIGLFPMVLALFFLIGLPGLVGKSIGAQVAVLQAKDLVQGCEKSTTACVNIFDGDRLFAEGYLIDSSTSHIAFFDVNAQRARSVARTGLEVRATRLPGSTATR